MYSIIPISCVLGYEAMLKDVALLTHQPVVNAVAILAAGIKSVPWNRLLEEWYVLISIAGDMCD